MSNFIIIDIFLDWVVFLFTITIVSLYFFILSPFFAWRLIVKVLAKCFKAGELDSMASPLDVVFLPRTPAGNDQFLIVVVILEGKVDLIELKSNLVTILSTRNNSGKLIYRRFQQCITTWLGFAFFKWEKNFSIDKHVRNENANINEVNRSDYVLSQYDLPFELESSFWDLTLVPNYNDENKTLLLFRQSHMICDGISLVKLLTSKFMTLENPVASFDSSHEKTTIPKQNITSLCKDLYKNSIGLPRWYFKNVSPPKNLMFTSTHDKSLEQNRYWLSTTPEIPLSDMKRLKSELQVSFTTAITTAMTSVMCQYIKKYFSKETNNKEWVRLACPAPKSGHPDYKLVNH